MEFPQLYDPVAMGADMRDPINKEKGLKEPYIVRGGELMELIGESSDLNREMLNRCDIAYDGVPASSAMNFNPSFGKISMGEFCKVILTI